MGKILSTVKNPLRNFNVESRAHKIISQSEPRPSPRHEKDQIDVERLLKEYPQQYEESLKKNEQLDKHLKDIFVTSYDPNVSVKQEPNPARPLPVHREEVEEFLYGVKEPNKIPLGRTTLRNALEFISNHQLKPQEYSVKKSPKNICCQKKTSFYRVFEIYIPKERQTKAKFAGPSLPRVQILKRSRKQLPSESKTNDKT